MECPKCNNEKFIYYNEFGSGFMICKCDSLYVDYKKRVDKVLSKFEKPQGDVPQIY